MRSFLLLSALVAAAACGDREFATWRPQSPQSMARWANEAPPAQIVAAVRILKRTKPLNATVAMSGVIGPRGGHLWIPEAGVEVRFAPGAVVSATRITLTAIEGTDVAYEFMPHGLKFSAPVVVRQVLKKTTP